jgi:hypothetical protein
MESRAEMGKGNGGIGRIRAVIRQLRLKILIW